VKSDSNSLVAAFLRDLAATQKSKPSEWGYKRAAATVLDLPRPIESYVTAEGTLEKIPNIGPKSSAVILEILKNGTSSIVERAVEKTNTSTDIRRRRGLRQNFLSRAQVLAALENDELTGPSLSDYCGDLQMHSTWSDGSQTFDEIVETGLARGYSYSAVTDHSYGLRIARGVSMEDLRKQHKDIDRVNKRMNGRFHLLKGIEANIRADGTVDMTDDELDQIEVVVASPHSGLRSPNDQTPRMLRVVQTRGVHILGHPRGRMYGSRPGVTADWDAVFHAAARTRVAIEIDGDPSRQDIDFELARRAVAAGCLFALDSDAHASGELQYAETAIAHARLAGVPAERVVNCWPLDELLAWLDERRR
jgi:histidinol phosphatase-like PHP family hydrolase